MPRSPTRSFDMYARRSPEAQRALLTALRRLILAAEPRLAECISYGLPAFSLDGKAILAIGAAAQHCSLYPMSGRTIAAFAAPLAKFSTSKGTIRFELGRRLPAALIRRLVKHRIAEFEMRHVDDTSPAAPTSQPSKAAAAPGKPRSIAVAQRLCEAVSELLEARNIEHERAIRSVRMAILKADARIIEAIKWNAPSYRLEEFFATIHLRPPAGSLQIVLHRGAGRSTRNRKPVTLASFSPKVCTLRWPDGQRCIATLPLSKKGTLPRAALSAVTTIISQWIGQA